MAVNHLLVEELRQTPADQQRIELQIDSWRVATDLIRTPKKGNHFHVRTRLV